MMKIKITSVLLFVVVFLGLLFFISKDIQANNMLKKFCALPVDSFVSISLVEEYGYGAEKVTSEYRLKKDTPDYSVIESLYIDMRGSLQEGAPEPKKGELDGVGSIILYINDYTYYKLSIAYIGSFNAVYIHLSNEKKHSKTMNYFIDRIKVDAFFNEFEKIKTQSSYVELLTY